MGDPKKQHKKYETPSHPWQLDRIQRESKIVARYGLKNHREVWKAEGRLRNFRRQARKLLARQTEQAKQEERRLLDKLYRLGLLPENATLDDVLKLTLEDVLKRRLQSVVYYRGLAKTPRQARQFVVHGHIAIGDRRVSIPSYFVTREEEEQVCYYQGSPLADSKHPEHSEPVLREAELRIQAEPASTPKKRLIEVVAGEEMGIAEEE